MDELPTLHGLSFLKRRVERVTEHLCRVTGTQELCAGEVKPGIWHLSPQWKEAAGTVTVILVICGQVLGTHICHCGTWGSMTLERSEVTPKM